MVGYQMRVAWLHMMVWCKHGF